MKTREEQMQWIRNASNEDLLREYTQMQTYIDLSEIVKNASKFGMSPLDLVNMVKALRDEIIRRMSKPA